jgi:F0F1-type ATP synthase membrane subunit c/vacuolar-type H+-ATPase subunit K
MSALRWWLILGVGVLASAIAGGGAVGRLVGAVARELARLA